MAQSSWETPGRHFTTASEGAAVLLHDAEALVDTQLQLAIPLRSSFYPGNVVGLF